MGPSAGPVPAWLRGGTVPRKDPADEEGVSAGLEAELRGEGGGLYRLGVTTGAQRGAVGEDSRVSGSVRRRGGTMLLYHLTSSTDQQDHLPSPRVLLENPLHLQHTPPP